LREDETLGAITNRIKQYAAAKQKFCLTYVPAAPHSPFDGLPERFKRFDQAKATYPDVTPSYLNELVFMDWIITSIVDQLKDSGLLDKTLIVITGDHGEMLGENGGPLGHGWAFTPELGNVPLIILNPARPGYRVNSTLGSQVDMFPTILDILGISRPGGQLYQGTSLYSANADSKRTIYLNSFQQYGVFQSGLLFCGTPEGPDGYYTYTNDGARTIFKKFDGTPGAGGSAPTIAPFNRFQANFLRNYPDYCRMAEQNVAAR
jgi:arylsulfatase A-like enzyme